MVTPWAFGHFLLRSQGIFALPVGKDSTQRSVQFSGAGSELDDVLEHYVEVVEAMAEPPIIIGHSLGGLIVQLLIQRGMGAVGVAIAPTPPHRRFMLDVPLQLSDDAALERCNLASTLKMISFEAFQYAVANELAYEAQSEAYQEYASPQSMRVVLSAVPTSPDMCKSLSRIVT